jgi:hypothetical protein
VLATMSLVLDLIFPIRDFPSADLMIVKATCLRNAGIINDRQWGLVYDRAEPLLRRDAGIAASVRECERCAAEHVMRS